MNDSIHSFYRTQRNLNETREFRQRLSEDPNCATVATCAIIGGVVGALIPPHGTLIIPGVAVGALVGVALESCRQHIRNQRNQ